MLTSTMSAGGYLFSMRKDIIASGEYYHVYSRGTDRRLTYYDDSDRERFVRGMIAFNDAGRTRVELSRFKCYPSPSANPLVDVLSYTLMPNHHHLLLRQNVDNGAALFMQRLGAGYACYFNRRYGRTGCLWESEYKAVRIENDAQMLHISRYIHLNPLKLYYPNWKAEGVPSWEDANRRLKLYKWSSYPHFLGLINDAAINNSYVLTLFKGPQDYEKFMQEWVMQTVGA